MSIVLSEYQQKIEDFFKHGEGNLVISAVAGSGKTFTIIHCSQFLPKSAASIFLAFNSHIVKELKAKLPSNIEARTCHSLGFGPCIGNSPSRKLIVDGRDGNTWRDKYGDICEDIIKRDFKSLTWEQRRDYKNVLKDLVNFSRNTLCDNTKDALVEMAIEYNIEVKDERLYGYVPGILETGIEIYKRTGAVDFTDMIWLPIVLNMTLRKFDYILVDEFQDLNRLQHELIFRSCHAKTRIFVVGDPKQSMYKFTGSLTGSMDVFKHRANAIELPLSICYRCPKSVIEIARLLDGGRTEASPTAKDGLVEFILQDDIYKHVKSRDLIVCRLTAPLLRICIRLISMGVAAKVLGRNIGKQLVDVIDAAMASEESNSLCQWSEFPSLLDALETGMSARLSKQKDGDKLVEAFVDKVTAIRACYTSPSFNITSQEAFVKQLTSLFSETQSPIALATIHRVKGLEADNVFIICDASERDVVPFIYKNQSLEDLDQEICILYVAVTRPKEVLRFCSSTQKAMDRHKDRFLKGTIKQFIHDIPKEIPPDIPKIEISVTEIPDKPEKKKKKKKKKYLIDA